MGVRFIPVSEFLEVETVTTYYATSGSGAGAIRRLDPTIVTAWQDGACPTFVSGLKDSVDTEITFSSQARKRTIPTTFDVIFPGNSPDLDPFEGAEAMPER